MRQSRPSLTDAGPVSMCVLLASLALTAAQTSPIAEENHAFLDDGPWANPTTAGRTMLGLVRVLPALDMSFTMIPRSLSGGPTSSWKKVFFVGNTSAERHPSVYYGDKREQGTPRLHVSYRNEYNDDSPEWVGRCPDLTATNPFNASAASAAGCHDSCNCMVETEVALGTTYRVRVTLVSRRFSLYVDDVLQAAVTLPYAPAADEMDPVWLGGAPYRHLSSANHPIPLAEDPADVDLKALLIRSYEPAPPDAARVVVESGGRIVVQSGGVLRVGDPLE